MTRNTAFLLLTCVASALFAPSTARPAEKRSSYLDASLGLGGSQYRSLALNLEYGLDPDWALLVRLSGSSDETLESTREGRVGASRYFTDSVTGKALLIGRGEPNLVHAGGLQLGGTWTVSSLWRAKLHTLLSADLTWLGYSQGTSTVTSSGNGSGNSGKNTLSPSATIGQSAFTLGISQELSSELTLRLYLTNYGYSGDPTALSTAVGVRTASISGMQGLAEGFPESSFTLGGSWKGVKRWILGMSVSSTRLAIDQSRVGTVGFTGDYEINRSWTLLNELSFTGSSSTQPGNALYMVGVEYMW